MRSGNFDVDDLALSGAKIVRYRRFEDHRGWFSETWHAEHFAKLGMSNVFVQHNESFSRRAGTVRGLHFQYPPATQAKLVRVLVGRVRDVIVDLRIDSPTFGKHLMVEMSAEEPMLLFVPRGFAHGFLTLMDNTIVAYTVDAVYSPKLDGGIAWNDPDLAIPWGISADQAIVSEKDRTLPRLRDISSPFTCAS